MAGKTNQTINRGCEIEEKLVTCDKIILIMKKRLLIVVILLIGFNFVSSAQTTMPSAETVMNKALAQAAKQKKKVFVIFHASWCGWCKKMEACINDPTLKAMFDANYVMAYLDVMESPEKEALENPGAMAYMIQYQGDKSGLPFWFIADDKGNKLADSQNRPEGASLSTYGENVGCPAEESEITYFAKVLTATSKLNADQLLVISKRFALNKQ